MKALLGLVPGFLGLLLLVCATPARGQKRPSALPVDRVNMLLGTTGADPVEYGGIIPGLTTPFGMTQ